MSSPQQAPRIDTKPHRSVQLAAALVLLTWFVAANELAARAARGLSVHFQLSDEYQFIEALFLVFLLCVGAMLLQSVFASGHTLRQAIGLPRRPSAGREWATGTAIGWSLIVLALVPQVLFGALHVRFWMGARPIYLLLLNLATVALLSVASEIGFRGPAFSRLIEGIGTTWALVVVSVLSGIAGSFQRDATVLSILTGTLFGAILCLGWLRTHGLWMSWGIHFAWIVSLGLLFGLPVNGIDNLSSVIEARAIGRLWLTGGRYGIEAAPWTLLCCAGGIVAVILVTSDWAWNYTRKPLIPAGYPMDVPPPASHSEMERTIAPPPPPLVQILPVTSQSRSAEPGQ